MKAELQPRLDELFRIAELGEWDGHDRAWHKVVATTHAELDALTRGADKAQAEKREEAK